MTTLQLVALILTSGVGGIVAAIVLSHREAVKWQLLITLLAIATVFLISDSNAIATAITVAVLSWALHLAAALGAIRRG